MSDAVDENHFLLTAPSSRRPRLMTLIWEMHIGFGPIFDDGATVGGIDRHAAVSIEISWSLRWPRGERHMLLIDRGVATEMLKPFLGKGAAIPA